MKMWSMSQRCLGLSELYRLPRLCFQNKFSGKCPLYCNTTLSSCPKAAAFAEGNGYPEGRHKELDEGTRWNLGDIAEYQ